mmetsp:Transcript_1133/g.2592  ORF Transcript_1133/g.2592 Transcript_1133/m.2592 type:complete len:615 (-) Transcript_1133:50-1894(-)
MSDGQIAIAVPTDPLPLEQTQSEVSNDGASPAFSATRPDTLTDGPPRDGPAEDDGEVESQDGGSGSSPPRWHVAAYHTGKDKPPRKPPAERHKRPGPWAYPLNDSKQRWPEGGALHGGTAHPLEARSHPVWFGYRELRSRHDWFPKQEQVMHDIPELRLDEIVRFLTEKFGSLGRAFKYLDVFSDKQLSMTEWNEGLFQLLSHAAGTDASRFHLACQPKRRFEEHMVKLFQMIDKNSDGLISYQDIAAATAETPSEGMFAFSLRRQAELSSSKTERSLARARSQLPPTLAKQLTHPAMDVSPSRLPVAVPAFVKEFAQHLATKFPGTADAYSAFNRTGRRERRDLSLDDFLDGARRMGYKGSAAKVFKELDANANGALDANEFHKLQELVDEVRSATLAAEAAEAHALAAYSIAVETRKDVVAAKKKRSPIQAPAALSRGDCLASLDPFRPLGTHMASSAGFHTFNREATGRLDDTIHPNQLPGVDSEAFSPFHGPGCSERGVEAFPEVGLADHPLRGAKWQVGGCMPRTKRFGPIMPTRQAQFDEECRSCNFATYAGQAPNDTWTIRGTGSQALRLTQGRFGQSAVKAGIPTHGAKASSLLKARSDPCVRMTL